MDIDPNLIEVSNRQRSEVSVDDQFVASVKRRLIHPIVLRQVNGNDNPTLVVGGRRLAALKKAEINPLIENVHFRFFENLSPDEAEEIELEENIKRSDLPWRDQIQAVGRLHTKYKTNESNWTIEKTSQRINVSARHLKMWLAVYKHLDSTLLSTADSINQAFSILQLAAERRTAEIINQITNTGTKVFDRETRHEAEAIQPDPVLSNESPTSLGEARSPDSQHPSLPPSSPTGETPAQPKRPPPIQVGDFLTWAQDPKLDRKFNVIHVDFPYGIEYKGYAKTITNIEDDYDSSDSQTFNKLLNSFVENLDKFCSYSAHVIFWFSMEFYEQTRLKLESAGLYVHRHPLIWHRTDNAGIIPGRDHKYPRRIYETAFLCSRAKRPLVKQLANCYGCPTVSNPLHPSHKPEAMLRHFLSMVCDETTDVFDPTAGSGSALRAAEDLGVRSTFGLELDPKYASSANAEILKTRSLRRAVGT